MQPNPAGTIGGVDQEATLSATLDDGKKVPAQLFQRKYLTPGRSLIAISVAGPTANSAQCQYSAIIQSFSATGQEFNGATPEASASATNGN
jgi:hypothetical protein